MPIVFATHNQNKLQEIQSLLPQHAVVSLQQLNFTQDIPETGETLEENAFIKANTIFKAFVQAVFADDTGLEVTVLKGAPGVYSARYAGKKANAEDNMQKLLGALDGAVDRSAQFRTAVAYINEKGQEFLFEGCVKGSILTKKTGGKGFGYDPIFKPIGYNQSFAQMSTELKNKISHRGLAIQKLIQHLEHEKS
jgi:XTP/dITP diphosphohydrolase